MTETLCIAGQGCTPMVSCTVNDGKITEFAVWRKNRTTHVPVDESLSRRLVLVKAKAHAAPKNTHVCSYLTTLAARKLAHAVENLTCSVREEVIYQMALALTSQYGYQIANKAKPIAEQDSLCRVYVGNYVLYVLSRDAV